MVSGKTLRDWFVIALILLFLPKENKLTGLDIRPQDWYGEMQIPLGREYLILAKNSSAEKVDINISGNYNITYLQEGQPSGMQAKNRSVGMPESLIVVRAEGLNSAKQRRVAFMDEKYYFEPGGLSIFTQSDLYLTYLFLGTLAGGFIVLGFLVARHTVEEDPESPDR